MIFLTIRFFIEYTINNNVSARFQRKKKLKGKKIYFKFLGTLMLFKVEK